MSSVLSASLYLAGALLGAGIALQQVVNANLRTALGSPFWAALTNFAVGTAVLTVVVAILRAPAPSLQAMARVPPYAWTGGLLGAAYVTGAILLIPRLGAASLVALFIVGQLLGSLAFDHFGVMGLSVHEVSWPRLLGVALLIGGAALVTSF